MTFANKFGAPQPPVQNPAAAGARPGGFAGRAAAPVSRFAGLTLNPSTPQIPVGNHLLEVSNVEFVHPESGEMLLIHFTVLQSDTATPGFSCAWKRTMTVNARGGNQIVFTSIAKALLPIMGVSLNDQEAQAGALAYLDQTWEEFCASCTIGGESLVGSRVLCTGTQGKEKTTSPGEFYTNCFFAPAPAA